MYGRKRYPSMVWLLVQASIVFCYTSPAFCKPYRQKIHQEENTNNLENNKTIIQATNNPAEHSVHIDKNILDPSFNSPAQLSDSNKDKLKTNVRAPLLHESVIFKAVVSNINVVTLQEENSTNNGQLPKHFPETGKQEHQDANDSHNSDHRESKAHLKWDGHVVAAPLKYDPQVSNFQTPRRVSDTVSTSKMVLSLLTAAAALGSICLTVAIFQCCCRRKRSSSDEDEDQIIDDQRSKEKATVKPVDTHEQAVEPESSEKDVHIPQTDTPVETPTGQTTINGETVQKASEKKEEEEEEQVSVKDKIKAFETQALKPLSPENVEHHRTLIKRPHSRAITECESESLSSSTTLIMGQVFRKRADTEKCQRKETVSTSQKVKKDDDYFGVIGRETEVLKSYRRAPAPRNRNKATKALYRKTMPNMDSTERSDMEISMSDWESTVHSFHQVESPFGKQDSKKKKKTPIPLPLPNQNAKDEVDNKLEDSTDGVEKTETKTEETTMDTVSASDTQNLKSAESTENNTPDMTSSSGDEASQGEETKIKEEMKEDETNKDGKEEVELDKEGEEKKEEEKKKEEKKEEEKKKEEKKEEEEKGEEKEKKIKEEEEERLIKEKKEKEKLKKEAEEKEKLKKEAEGKEKLKKEAEEKEEKKLKEDEKMKEGKKAKREAEKAKEEELKKEKTNKDKEQEKREKEKESEVKREKEKQLKKEKELKREKDEIKREKEELNKEELKKGKEQLEKEGGKAENIFFQIDPTAEPTAAKLVKRDSGHESNETNVQLRESKDDLPKNDESPKSKRHLAHLDRTTMFMLPGQKPEDHMSLMLSLKEKLNDKKEKNELDADTDTKMDVDPEPETEKLEAPEC